MRGSIFLILLLMACGPTHDLRKAKRLIARAKSKGVEVKADTVYVERTIFHPGEKTTVVLPGTVKDTTIYQDKIKIQVIHDKVKEYIKVQCPPDTIRIKVPVTVRESIICPPPSHFWRTVALVLACVLTVGILIRKWIP